MNRHTNRRIRGSAAIKSSANGLSRYCLPLPRRVLKALDDRGVFCLPAVSIEHQHLAHRYVLRAIESGGAVADMGRYCAWTSDDGKPIPWLQPIDSISGNGRHAIILAPELVRIEMLRVEHTYELAITRLWLNAVEGRKRPVIAAEVLFRGRYGFLHTDLWRAENRALRGIVSPLFHSAAGEVHEFPEKLTAAICSVTGALSCIGCKHTHVAVAPPAVAAKERQS